MAVDKDAAAPPCLVVHGTSWARLWMPKRLGSGSDWIRQPRVVPRAAGRVPVGKVLLAAFIVVDKDDVGGGLFALIVDKDEVGSGLFALVRGSLKWKVITSAIKINSWCPIEPVPLTSFSKVIP